MVRQLRKVINKLHPESAIDRFLRSSPLNKPFFTFFDPVLLKQKYWSFSIVKLNWTEVNSVLYQPRKTIRVALEIRKMNPALRYFLSLTLKLARNQLHTSSLKCQGRHSKGTVKEFLSRIILARRLCHMAIKVFRIFFITAISNCTIITLLDDSNLNGFQTFWPRLYILHLADVPWIIDDCNFPSADSLASLSNFSFNYKFYDNCRNSRALIGWFLLSICGQTHDLKFMRRVSELEPAIWQFVIVKNKLMSVFNASVLLLIMNFVITLSK